MLYHCELGFPKNIPNNFGTILLDYSRHALEASQNDRYGTIRLPRTLDTEKAKLIEIEVIKGQLTKAVYRCEHCNKFDIVIVVIPNARKVKTVWLNRKIDKHKTLNRNKYCVPV
jgi:hypothetical protein